jgi:hypothetical protein
MARFTQVTEEAEKWRVSAYERRASAKEEEVKLQTFKALYGPGSGVTEMERSEALGAKRKRFLSSILSSEAGGEIPSGILNEKRFKNTPAEGDLDVSNDFGCCAVGESCMTQLTRNVVP